MARNPRRETMLDRCDLFGKLKSEEEYLQWLVLGMLIADPALRPLVKYEDFSQGFAGAVLELQKSEAAGGWAWQGWKWLRDSLARCGVDWKGGQSPINKVLRRLRLDAETSRVSNYVATHVLDFLGRDKLSDGQKARFLKEMSLMTRRLQVDLSACAMVEPEKEKDDDAAASTILAPKK